MILLIGTPCSGKSTIGRMLANTTGQDFITLDEFIAKDVEEKNIATGAILTDSFIDGAVEKFVNHMYDLGEKSIYELPHHDYQSFFERNALSEQIVIVGFSTPLRILLERNRQRAMQARIPVPYLKRAFRSIEGQKKKNTGIHFFNTARLSPEIIVQSIIKLQHQSNGK